MGLATVPGVSEAIRTDLTGKVALVSGASRGLGAAVARTLAGAGADVVITYRKEEERAVVVAEQVRDAGRRAWARPLELAEPESIDALFDWMDEEVGALDVVVANAAATKFVGLLDAEPRHVERTFAISVMGFLHLVRRAVAVMPEGGRIVAVSGADTRTYIPAHGLLAAAKAAMETMVRYLACELGGRGVTVVGVNPGWMSGESIQKMLGPFYDDAVRTEEATHPLRRAASPEDIAEVVALMCGEAATWLSGSTVEADGAGIFAFCGRYTELAARLSIGRGVDPTAGDAPSVRLED